MVQKLRKRPVVIIIRDGWGQNPYTAWNHANAVYLARKPVDDALRAEFPTTLIRTSGYDVGLPQGVMGNSEVGHQNIGAGRIVEQEVMRITGRILDGSFFSNPVLLGAFQEAKSSGGRVHLLGLCSDGRVHSDLEHLEALLELARRTGFAGDRLFVHAILDGRDTPPRSGAAFLECVERKCTEIGANPVASVAGRYYAMDRDDRWERTRVAYEMLTGQWSADSPPCFSSAAEALRAYYGAPTAATMQGDEFVPPAVTLRGQAQEGRIRDGDSVIFFNFRGDRPRQLVKAFVCETFPFDGVDKNGKSSTMGFARGRKLKLYFATMTAYEQGLDVRVAFAKPPKMRNILGACLSELGLRQFRCAETEKFAHVTFFFNDYRDEPFPREDRALIPSPREFATYDLVPGMSAEGVTDEVIRRVRSGVYDVMVVNFANCDMVGHTGSLPAAIEAVEATDRGVGRIVEAVRAVGGALIVTADHGNAEQMIDPVTGGPHTYHTTYDVPLIVVDDDAKHVALRADGRLADIAPTTLALLGLPKPEEMTGTALVPLPLPPHG